MKKKYQVIGEKNNSPEVLEIVSSREEAEYTMAHYMILDEVKEWNFYILEANSL